MVVREVYLRLHLTPQEVPTLLEFLVFYPPQINPLSLSPFQLLPPRLLLFIPSPTQIPVSSTFKIYPEFDPSSLSLRYTPISHRNCHSLLYSLLLPLPPFFLFHPSSCQELVKVLNRIPCAQNPPSASCRTQSESPIFSHLAHSVLQSYWFLHPSVLLPEWDLYTSCFL